MQMGVNQKFLDTAISVREAAVDLIGKYVLSSEELIDQYYEMLSTRILVSLSLTFACPGKTLTASSCTGYWSFSSETCHQNFARYLHRVSGL